MKSRKDPHTLVEVLVFGTLTVRVLVVVIVAHMRSAVSVTQCVDQAVGVTVTVKSLLLISLTPSEFGDVLTWSSCHIRDTLSSMQLLPRPF